MIELLSPAGSPEAVIAAVREEVNREMTKHPLFAW
jgi:hypothetical protein